MVKVKKEKLGDVTFEVTQLGFTDSRRLFVRLAKALGPGFAQVAEKAASLKVLELSGLVKSAVENLGDADLEEIAEILGAVTRFSRDGVKWPFLDASNREALFSGELFLFFRWLWFALQAQYGDFSVALVGPPAADHAHEQAPSPKDTPAS